MRRVRKSTPPYVLAVIEGNGLHGISRDERDRREIDVASHLHLRQLGDDFIKPSVRRYGQWRSIVNTSANAACPSPFKGLSLS